MDIGKMLRRAWEITWRHKILWLFGFIIALTSGGGSSNRGVSYSYRLDYSDLQRMRMPEAWIVVPMVLLMLLVLAAAIVLSVIAQGALIDGARQATRGDEVKGSAAWRKGTGRFWPLLGIRAIMFVVGLVLVIPLVAMVLLAVLPAQRGIGAGEGGIIAAICGVALCCLPLVPIMIVLGLIALYADRACVLDGLGVFDALKEGWETLKNNLGPTLLVAVVLFAIQMVVGVVFAGGLLGITLPAGGVWGMAHNWRAAMVPVCCLGLLGGLVLLAVTTVLQTFVSSAWTLTYLELHLQVSETEEVSLPPAEPPAAAE